MRTLSFSHDGKMLASASEDHFIDIAEVETGNGFFWGSSKKGEVELGGHRKNQCESVAMQSRAP